MKNFDQEDTLERLKASYRYLKSIDIPEISTLDDQKRAEAVHLIEEIGLKISEMRVKVE
ncbi:hypothetical protein ABEX78_04335 [Priestia megaterium]|uniref:Uncharacterized protein n=2 Tax=Priestia TaxID=2800373 RepID=A0AAX6N3G1_PRIAR|nr:MULTISPECIES: hypothetical protein [Priestia]MBU8853151.1 hypothetical protein [Bacillus sp. FJAT-26377]AEN90055.1 hypothetical protein BMWSH_3173 [Priestia megaterium WSH-002]MDU9690451.1 hypothetical protein [Priestia aryabhattai]MED5244296.1 hypothetical protein [Priestia sp. LL-8]WKG28972.1 hypothetical protein QYS54_17605 [Priestia aryabhattai]